MLDLAAMLAVREAGRKPETYYELAFWLSRKLSLDDESAKFLVGLAGFRNILVHGYASIDESLEAVAFREIVEKLPHILDKLKSIVAGDPDPSIKSAFRRVASKNILRYLFLFGSRTRGGFGRYSDLAVAFEKRLTIALELDLLVVDPEEALGVHEELIDLVDLDTAPLSLVKTVVDEGKMIYGDNEALDYLWRKYLEYLDANELSERIDV